MEVTISHSGVANSVQVSASIPHVVQVAPSMPIVIEMQLFRDRINGKSAYQIAVENGYTGTEQQWINDLLPQDIDGGIIF